MTSERRSDVTIDVRRDVVMFHTVLCVSADKVPVAVAITTNPLDHPYYAQVVMHKTRSHSCAVQVARYVRRTFGVTEPVSTRRAVRPVEAMIGYACADGMQHAPTEATPGWGVFQHIAITPISRLLEEVADGHNAARTRYVVYEVRCDGHPALRGVTHNYPAVERRYLEAPPDAYWPAVAQVVQVGRFPTADDAMALLTPLHRADDRLWTRRPPIEYLRRVLRVTPEGEIVWTCDGAPAVRRHYDTPCVCVGPHVYTEAQIRHALAHGAWTDGRSIEGRRARLLAEGSGRLAPP